MGVFLLLFLFVGLFCKCAPLYAGPFDASGGCILCSLFTRRVLSLFVRAAFCVHSCASAAYPSGSVAVGLCTRIRRRTTAPNPPVPVPPSPSPPPGAQSRPFARILSQSHRKRNREDEKEKSHYWPMVTQTLFLYTHTHSRRIRHHVMINKIFICNALFVSKMEDVCELPVRFSRFPPLWAALHHV